MDELAPTVTTDFRSPLRELALALRTYHRILVDVARAGYERQHGPLQGPFSLLRLLSSDPFFAWLRPLSEFIVGLDELLDEQEPPQSEQASALRAEVERLLGTRGGERAESDFILQQRAALQAEPAVGVELGRVHQILAGLPAAEPPIASQVLHERHVQTEQHEHRDPWD